MTDSTGQTVDADTGFEGWQREWRDERPDWRLIEVFFPVSRAPVAIALEILSSEWLEAGLAIREPDVARRKLAWWIEEIGEFAAGKARHPLTRAVTGEVGADRVAPSLARAVAAAISLVEIEAFSSTEDLVAAATPFASAIAESAEALRLWTQSPAMPIRGLAAAAVADLVRDWERFSRPERGLVPLSLLARHGIDRASANAGDAAEACDALVRDFALELQVAVSADPAFGLAGAKMAIARLWLDAMARAPRAARERRLSLPRFRLPWVLWSVARASWKQDQ
jgi:phytoene synthase